MGIELTVTKSDAVVFLALVHGISATSTSSSPPDSYKGSSVVFWPLIDKKLIGLANWPYKQQDPSKLTKLEICFNKGETNWDTKGHKRTENSPNIEKDTKGQQRIFSYKNTLNVNSSY
ncbi:hypothetical protein BpHYR1_015841 [Brachionus plicatilis]|uniref:Uncharacterized protein n=1 Tax=Brachionus plicatilis TaxID=10195 RepID=A0A3M7RJ40_BRAPC|nr:hypothetical protein BpHYR1_015841 [Brachionus plicatilis]